MGFCNITFLYNEVRKRGLEYKVLGEAAEGIDLHPSGGVSLAEGVVLPVNVAYLPLDNRSILKA